MRPSHVQILLVLARYTNKRRSMTQSRLAGELPGLRGDAPRNPRAIRPALDQLAADGLVEIGTRQEGRRHTIARITPDGRKWLKLHPECARLSEGLLCQYSMETTDTIVSSVSTTAGTGGTTVPVKKRLQEQYAELHALWRALGLERIVLDAPPAVIHKRGGGKKHIRGFMRKCEDYADATAGIDARRGISSVFYCPAHVSIARSGKKRFWRTRALWVDLDLPRSPAGDPLPVNQREAELSRVLQEMVGDGIVPFATVSSGAGYHVYIMLYRYIRNWKRVRLALLHLAERYGGDPKTAYPQAFLRPPGSQNRKVWDGPRGAGATITLPCEVHSFIAEDEHRTKHSLKAIETVLGYDWQEERHKPLPGKEKRYMPVGTVSSRMWPLTDIKRFIRTGKVPVGNSPSEQDFFLMCQLIRHRYTKQAILDLFCDHKNGVSIHRPRGKKKHDKSYLYRTYREAFIDVHGRAPAPPDPHDS